MKSTSEYLAVTLFLLTGAIFLILSNVPLVEQYELRRISENIGIALLTTGIISLLYELHLRKTYVERSAEAFKQIVEDRMPKRYNDLSKSGIYSAFERLNPEKVNEYIDLAVKGSKICFLKIWISNLESIGDSILRAIIEKDCKVQILLLDPTDIDAIDARARSIKNDNVTRESIINDINRNVHYIETWKKEIAEKDSRRLSNLQLKLHSNFVSTSLIRIQDNMLIGFYLRNKNATSNVHVHFKGRSKSHFISFVDHFKSSWEDDSNRDYFQETQSEGTKGKTG